jgi:hypothetical protein
MPKTAIKGKYVISDKPRNAGIKKRYAARCSLIAIFALFFLFFMSFIPLSRIINQWGRPHMHFCFSGAPYDSTVTSQ